MKKERGINLKGRGLLCTQFKSITYVSIALELNQLKERNMRVRPPTHQALTVIKTQSKQIHLQNVTIAQQMEWKTGFLLCRFIINIINETCKNS